MYNMFNPLHSLLKYTYVTFIFSFTPASGRYIGEISKSAPIPVKIILFYWQSMGHNQNLISTQLSLKSTFNNIFSINHWLLKPWHFGKFHHWPCFVHQGMFHVWSNGKFPIFLFLFGSLAIKAMAFWEISPLALLHASSYVSCMVKWEIFNISLSVWHIGC